MRTLDPLNMSSVIGQRTYLGPKTAEGTNRVLAFKGLLVE